MEGEKALLVFVYRLQERDLSGGGGYTSRQEDSDEDREGSNGKKLGACGIGSSGGEIMSGEGS